MVVIVIMVLLITLSLPALGRMLDSNRQAEAVNTINGLLSTAQASAIANATTVGLRIERAFDTEQVRIPAAITGQEFEIMRKTPPVSGEGVWLDHQQARFLVFATSRDSKLRQLPDSKVTPLPRTVWFAPAEVVNWAPAQLTNTALKVDPTVNPDGANATVYSRLDNFMVAFNAAGELSRFPASNNLYADVTQVYQNSSNEPEVPIVAHPEDSSRGLILYDREQFDKNVPDNGQARLDFFRAQRQVFINRSMGGVIEEAPQ